MEKWESESLDWIHKVRDEIFQEKRGMDLWQTAQETANQADHLIQEWKLRAVQKENIQTSYHPPA